MHIMQQQSYRNQGACLYLLLDPKAGTNIDLLAQHNCCLEIDKVSPDAGIDYRFVVTSRILGKAVRQVSATGAFTSNNKTDKRNLSFIHKNSIFFCPFTFCPDDIEHRGDLKIVIQKESTKVGRLTTEVVYEFFYMITCKSVFDAEIQAECLPSTKRETKTSNEHFTIDPSYTPSLDKLLKNQKEVFPKETQNPVKEHREINGEYTIDPTYTPTRDKLLKNQKEDPLQEIRHQVEDLKKSLEEMKSYLTDLCSSQSQMKELSSKLLNIEVHIKNKVDRGEIQLLHEKIAKQEKEMERFRQPDFSFFTASLKKSFEAKAQALIQEALSPSAPSDAARPIQALQQLFQNPQSPATLLLQKDSRFAPPIQKIGAAIQCLYRQAFPSAETVTPPDFTVPMNYSDFCQSPRYEGMLQSDPSRFYDPAAAYRHFVHDSFQETLKRFKPGCISDNSAVVIEKLHMYVAAHLLDDLRALEEAERAAAMDCPEASALVSEFFRQFLNELGLEPYEAKAGDLFIAGKFEMDRNSPVPQMGKVKRTIHRGIRYKERPDLIWYPGLVILD